MGIQRLVLYFRGSENIPTKQFKNCTKTKKKIVQHDKNFRKLYENLTVDFKSSILNMNPRIRKKVTENKWY